MRPPRSNPWGWMTDERVTFALKILMVVVLILFIAESLLTFVERIQGVVYVLVGAIFFAYIIYPAVHRLARRMPLGAAIIVVYAAIVAAMILGLTYVVPSISHDVVRLIQNAPRLNSQIVALVYDPRNVLMAHAPAWLRDEVAHVPATTVEWIQAHGFHALGGALSVLVGTFTIVATFVVIPLITAYLLLDLDNLLAGLSSVIPLARWRATLGLLSDVDAVIGGFVRGQLIVAFTVGILITLAMMLLHVRYAFLLGFIAAVGDLIPYVGAVIAFIPAFGSAFLNDGFSHALLVLVAFVAIYEMEGHFIAPYVVGRQVRLSPFVILLALLIGAELAGLIGMVVAVPVAGVLRVVALRVFRPPGPNEPPP